MQDQNQQKRPPEVLYKKGVLKNLAKRLHQSLFKSCRTEVCKFIKKENPTQVFSSEFREISKNTFL